MKITFLVWGVNELWIWDLLLSFKTQATAIPHIYLWLTYLNHFSDYYFMWSKCSFFYIKSYKMERARKQEKWDPQNGAAFLFESDYNCSLLGRIDDEEWQHKIISSSSWLRRLHQFKAFLMPVTFNYFRAGALVQWLREEAHVPKVMGLNPSAIYCMDMTFFTLIWCKNCNDVCLKRPKINEKEAGVGPI